MATFGKWLDDYDGEDNVVAGVARIWAGAVGTRPRASAPVTISNWLTTERGVHEEAMRAAVRAYNASRSPGRSLTDAEAAAFSAGNAGTIAPVTDQPGGHQQPDPPAEQPALPAEALPVVAAIVHALRPSLDAIVTRLGELTQGQMALLSWADAQDKRLEPIRRLLEELGEAEDAADAIDGQAAQQAYDGAAAAEPPPEPGSLWRNIAAAEPDFAAMAEAGDPAAADDHGP